MVKATLHLTINIFFNAIIFGFISSCSFLDKPQEMNIVGYRAERLDSIKNHYNKVFDSFLISRKNTGATKSHLLYLNNLINRKDFFKQLIILDSNDSFYFVSPDRRLLISSKASKIYFQSESLLAAFLVENMVRVERDLYSRKVFYSNYMIQPEDLVRIMNLSLKQKDVLNNLSVEQLIKIERSPVAYLNYLQQRNKDGELIFNLVNGRVYGLEEERHLKSYLLEQHKKEFINDTGLDISSSKFYLFKKFINKVFR